MFWWTEKYPVKKYSVNIQLFIINFICILTKAILLEVFNISCCVNRYEFMACRSTHLMCYTGNHQSELIDNIGSATILTWKQYFKMWYLSSRNINLKLFENFYTSASVNKDSRSWNDKCYRNCFIVHFKTTWHLDKILYNNLIFNLCMNELVQKILEQNYFQTFLHFIVQTNNFIRLGGLSGHNFHENIKIYIIYNWNLIS